MQHLEREAIEEKGKNCQSFLAACGMALQVCPPQKPRGTDVPSPIANGEHVLGHPLGHSPQMPTTKEESTPMISCSTTPVAPAPSPVTKWWHHLPDKVASSPWSGDKAARGPEQPPHQKQKDEMPLKKSLKGGQWEAFAKHSDLVQQAREDYFKTNHPHFTVRPHMIYLVSFGKWLHLPTS